MDPETTVAAETAPLNGEIIPPSSQAATAETIPAAEATPATPAAAPEADETPASVPEPAPAAIVAEPAQAPIAVGDDVLVNGQRLKVWGISRSAIDGDFVQLAGRSEWVATAHVTPAPVAEGQSR